MFRKCSCGGEFQRYSDEVYTSNPPLYPVRCNSCEFETRESELSLSESLEGCTPETFKSSKEDLEWDREKPKGKEII